MATKRQAPPTPAYTEHRDVDLAIALQALKGGLGMSYADALRIVEDGLAELLARRRQVQDLMYERNRETAR